jgi:hypothetical protein
LRYGLGSEDRIGVHVIQWQELYVPIICATWKMVEEGKRMNGFR